MASKRCLYCNELGMEHEDRDECISALQKRVQQLEAKIKFCGLGCTKHPECILDEGHDGPCGTVTQD